VKDALFRLLRKFSFFGCSTCSRHFDTTSFLLRYIVSYGSYQDFILATILDPRRYSERGGCDNSEEGAEQRALNRHYSERDECINSERDGRINSERDGRDNSERDGRNNSGRNNSKRNGRDNSKQRVPNNRHHNRHHNKALQRASLRRSAKRRVS
jgi:hypothetical protein